MSDHLIHRTELFPCLSALCVLWLTAAMLPAESTLMADSPKLPSGTDGFFQENCLDCHDGPDAEAGFDITKLGPDLANPKVLGDWVKVFDRVDASEMPPEEYGEIDAESKQDFLSSAGEWIREFQQDQYTEHGRVRGRRLTNLQFERTLHDLLAIDIPLADQMSDEPRSHGFQNIADAQAMSHFHLQSHLSVVDLALDTAFTRATERHEDLWSRRYSARELARSNPRRRCRDPEMRNGLAVTWSSGLVFYGRITSTTVRRSGWYRITFKASAVKKPDDHGVWCTVRSGRCSSGAPLMNWIGAFEATERPKEMTYEAWISEGDMLEIRPGDETLARARFQGGQVGAGEGEPQNVPGVGLHELLIEEIHPGGDVGEVRSKLFGELNIRQRKDGGIEITGDNLTDAVVDQLRRFARRAFRREVTDAQIAPYAQMLRRDIASGTSPIDALRSAYRSILCSPRFIYFVEPAGKLDDYAIASRLSYLFWAKMPDEELFELAGAGRLRDPKVLHDQVERMLGGDHGRQFVKDFAAQWLDLIDIDFTDPDRKLYRDFDIVVQDAMLAETHRFLESMIRSNAPARQLIDCDYTFLNSRLARFYGIDGVAGDRVRKVNLARGDHRGGLLAQGSILKVTANGSNTSPVLRGIWVNERLLGQTIPAPPENVPAIEPDIRGATTIREMLDKHRSDSACASCHKKIDPPGFALESFDAAGRWRDRYLQVSRGRVQRGSPVDSSYTLSDGRSFDGFDSFRELIAGEPSSIARGFAERLLIYATGSETTFADRGAIDEIVERSGETNFGLRSLIHAVVASPVFLNK